MLVMSTVLVSVLCMDPQRQRLTYEGKPPPERDATGNGEDKGGGDQGNIKGRIQEEGGGGVGKMGEMGRNNS